LAWADEQSPALPTAVEKARMLWRVLKGFLTGPIASPWGFVLALAMGVASHLRDHLLIALLFYLGAFGFIIFAVTKK
jgi:hypothetical protein